MYNSATNNNQCLKDIDWIHLTRTLTSEANSDAFTFVGCLFVQTVSFQKINEAPKKSEQYFPIIFYHWHFLVIIAIAARGSALNLRSATFSWYRSHKHLEKKKNLDIWECVRSYVKMLKARLTFSSVEPDSAIISSLSFSMKGIR